MRYYLFIPAFLLFSCGTKDTKMCECLEVGEELNQLSAKLLTSEVTEQQKKDLFRLRAEKDKKCKDFQTMGGEEMLKRKAECQK
jgi:hypothetical protein